ncbi:MAG: hypothetical protein AAFN17_14480, partial [Pseudomonadota bacterium]
MTQTDTGTMPAAAKEGETAGSPQPGIGRALLFAPSLVAALAFVWFLTFLPAIGRGEVFTLVYPWIPALGIEFAFLLDGLG